MIEKTTLCPDRVRKITGSFAFIEHRFLRDGFFKILTHHELSLYLFLILVADRKGLSYYSYDKICTLLKISTDEYILARNSLMEKDLIAFDGKLFQVLSLPEKPLQPPLHPLKGQEEMQQHDPATIHTLIVHSLGASHD
ncbi:MAG: hypothetical protein PVH02_19610 [Desulfobacteraceae bacterium]|jgi:hypothetical protein